LKEGKRNIAFVISRSKFIDIECDSEEAEAKLQEYFDGDIPPTPTWNADRGYHRLFQRPDGLPQKGVIWIDGIECRIGNGKAALSTLPPSIHESGSKYTWVDGLSIFEVEPAELPPNVVEKLKATGGNAANAASASSSGDIPEGKRNDTLFKLACRLHANGLGQNAIIGALKVENAARCQPPLPDEEVIGIGKSAVKQGAATLDSQIELWKSADGSAYATLEIDNHKEHWSVRSQHFQLFVRQFAYVYQGKIQSRSEVEKLVDGFEARALFSGEIHPLFLRVAEHAGRQYLDLGDSAWTVVEIDAEDWRITDEPPVRFRRPRGYGSLPCPVKGGSIDDLRRLLNVRKRDWPLLLAFLTYSLRPFGPYVILKIRGEQGSAKSTTIRVLRQLVDPNDAPARTKPRNEHDLAIAAENSWLCCLDNLSFIGTEISDAICRLATTGIGFATRRLYTNSDETLLNASRPIIMAGIEDVGSRSDLLDRSILIELPAIPEGQRRDEKSFWADFEAARPRILGVLLDAVSIGLRELPGVSLDRLPRMADFVKWATAVEGAFGFEAGTCQAAYEQNRSEAHMTVLEESLVASTLLRFMQRRNGKEYSGTATDLLDELRRFHSSDQHVLRDKSWPKNPRSLSAALNRLSPNLRHIGISVEHSTKGTGSEKRRSLIVKADEKLPPMSAHDAAVKLVGDHFRQKAAKRKK
jgi:hypothetical protein